MGSTSARLPVRLGRTVGTHRGRLFRSLLEYSYYRHLEALGVPPEGVVHEPYPIPYVLRGRRRMYHPDFLVPSLNRLVEVKCRRELLRRRGSLVRAAKFAAATAHCAERGLEFVVATEADFRAIPGRIALLDPDVVWIKRRPRR